VVGFCVVQLEVATFVHQYLVLFFCRRKQNKNKYNDGIWAPIRCDSVLVLFGDPCWLLRACGLIKAPQSVTSVNKVIFFKML
jgi:hypothetical protein